MSTPTEGEQASLYNSPPIVEKLFKTFTLQEIDDAWNAAQQKALKVAKEARTSLGAEYAVVLKSSEQLTEMLSIAKVIESASKGIAPCVSTLREALLVVPDGLATSNGVAKDQHTLHTSERSSFSTPPSSKRSYQKKRDEVVLLEPKGSVSSPSLKINEAEDLGGKAGFPAYVEDYRRSTVENEKGKSIGRDSARYEDIESSGALTADEEKLPRKGVHAKNVGEGSFPSESPSPSLSPQLYGSQEEYSVKDTLHIFNFLENLKHGGCRDRGNLSGFDWLLHTRTDFHTFSPSMPARMGENGFVFFYRQRVCSTLKRFVMIADEIWNHLRHNECKKALKMLFNDPDEILSELLSLRQEFEVGASSRCTTSGILESNQTSAAKNDGNFDGVGHSTKESKNRGNFSEDAAGNETHASPESFSEKKFGHFVSGKTSISPNVLPSHSSNHVICLLEKSQPSLRISDLLYLAILHPQRNGDFGTKEPEAGEKQDSTHLSSKNPPLLSHTGETTVKNSPHFEDLKDQKNPFSPPKDSLSSSYPLVGGMIVPSLHLQSTRISSSGTQSCEASRGDSTISRYSRSNKLVKQLIDSFFRLRSGISEALGYFQAEFNLPFDTVILVKAVISRLLQLPSQIVDLCYNSLQNPLATPCVLSECLITLTILQGPTMHNGIAEGPGTHGLRRRKVDFFGKLFFEKRSDCLEGLLALTSEDMHNLLARNRLSLPSTSFLQEKGEEKEGGVDGMQFPWLVRNRSLKAPDVGAAMRKGLAAADALLHPHQESRNNQGGGETYEDVCVPPVLGSHEDERISARLNPSEKLYDVHHFDVDGSLAFEDTNQLNAGRANSEDVIETKEKSLQSVVLSNEGLQGANSTNARARGGGACDLNSNCVLSSGKESDCSTINDRRKSGCAPRTAVGGHGGVHQPISVIIREMMHERRRLLAATRGSRDHGAVLTPLKSLKREQKEANKARGEQDKCLAAHLEVLATRLSYLIRAYNSSILTAADLFVFPVESSISTAEVGLPMMPENREERNNSGSAQRAEEKMEAVGRFGEEDCRGSFWSNETSNREESNLQKPYNSTLQAAEAADSSKDANSEQAASSRLNDEENRRLALIRSFFEEIAYPMSSSKETSCSVCVNFSPQAAPAANSEELDSLLHSQSEKGTMQVYEMLRLVAFMQEEKQDLLDASHSNERGEPSIVLQPTALARMFWKSTYEQWLCADAPGLMRSFHLYWSCSIAYHTLAALSYFVEITPNAAALMTLWRKVNEQLQKCNLLDHEALLSASADGDAFSLKTMEILRKLPLPQGFMESFCSTHFPTAVKMPLDILQHPIVALRVALQGAYHVVMQRQIYSLDSFSGLEDLVGYLLELNNKNGGVLRSSSHHVSCKNSLSNIQSMMDSLQKLNYAFSSSLDEDFLELLLQNKSIFPSKMLPPSLAHSYSLIRVDPSIYDASFPDSEAFGRYTSSSLQAGVTNDSNTLSCRNLLFQNPQEFEDFLVSLLWILRDFFSEDFFNTGNHSRSVKAGNSSEIEVSTAVIDAESSALRTGRLNSGESQQIHADEASGVVWKAVAPGWSAVEQDIQRTKELLRLLVVVIRANNLMASLGYALALKMGREELEKNPDFVLLKEALVFKPTKFAEDSLNPGIRRSPARASIEVEEESQFRSFTHIPAFLSMCLLSESEQVKEASFLLIHSFKVQALQATKSAVCLHLQDILQIFQSELLEVCLASSRISQYADSFSETRDTTLSSAVEKLLLQLKPSNSTKKLIFEVCNFLNDGAAVAGRTFADWRLVYQTKLCLAEELASSYEKLENSLDLAMKSLQTCEDGQEVFMKEAMIEGINAGEKPERVIPHHDLLSFEEASKPEKSNFEVAASTASKLPTSTASSAQQTIVDSSILSSFSKTSNTRFASSSNEFVGSSTSSLLYSASFTPSSSYFTEISTAEKLLKKWWEDYQPIAQALMNLSFLEDLIYVAAEAIPSENEDDIFISRKTMKMSLLDVRVCLEQRLSSSCPFLITIERIREIECVIRKSCTQRNFLLFKPLLSEKPLNSQSRLQNDAKNSFLGVSGGEADSVTEELNVLFHDAIPHIKNLPIFSYMKIPSSRFHGAEQVTPARPPSPPSVEKKYLPVPFVVKNEDKEKKGISNLAGRSGRNLVSSNENFTTSGGIDHTSSPIATSRSRPAFPSQNSDKARESFSSSLDTRNLQRNFPAFDTTHLPGRKVDSPPNAYTGGLATTSRISKNLPGWFPTDTVDLSKKFTNVTAFFNKQVGNVQSRVTEVVRKGMQTPSSSQAGSGGDEDESWRRWE